MAEVKVRRYKEKSNPSLTLKTHKNIGKLKVKLHKILSLKNELPSSAFQQKPSVKNLSQMDLYLSCIWQIMRSQTTSLNTQQAFLIKRHANHLLSTIKSNNTQVKLNNASVNSSNYKKISLLSVVLHSKIRSFLQSK